MTLVESVKEFISKCPHLTDLAKVNVDFLPEKPDTYSIEQVPTQPIIRQYLDGSSERQFTFVFASRFYYSEETKNNINNSGFYENFSKWLEECTLNGTLPELEEGMTPTKIEALSNGYLYNINGDLANARYQVQCRLIYDKD